MISIQYSENPKKRRAEKFFLYMTAGLAFVVVVCLILGLLVQFLWNATFAVAFGLPAITYWQAIGLFILAKFFFGFGTGSGGKSAYKYKKKTHARKDSDDVPTEDETFRRYWQQEGKEEYQAFLASRTRDQGSDTE